MCGDRVPYYRRDRCFDLHPRSDRRFPVKTGLRVEVPTARYQIVGIGIHAQPMTVAPLDRHRRRGTFILRFC